MISFVELKVNMRGKQMNKNTLILLLVIDSGREHLTAKYCNLMKLYSGGTIVKFS